MGNLFYENFMKTIGKKEMTINNIINIQKNLNKKGQVPLYAQLADVIRSDITKGILKKGDTLPTEKELEDSSERKHTNDKADFL